MTATVRTLSLATLGATVLAFSQALVASAITFTLSGTTGYAHSAYFPEYQNARYEGYMIVDDTDLLPDSEAEGLFKITDYFITIVNDCFPDFKATFKPNAHTVAKFYQDDLFIDLGDGDVFNDSKNNPTTGSLFLNFVGKVGTPNVLPTYGPVDGVFDPFKSFLKLGGSSNAPDLTIGITSAKVEAVPEPTTIAGATVFGLGLLLRKRNRNNSL